MTPELETKATRSYLDDLSVQGRSDRTIDAYRRVLADYEAFLDRRHSAPDEATYRDCLRWVDSIRSDHAESTVATYASYLHRFYAYMTSIGAFDDNPMSMVVEEMSESIDSDPTRRDLSIEDIRALVARIDHPLEVAVVMTLLKTGIRAGELCNLDQRDLVLADDPRDVTVRGQLESREAALYIDSQPSRGATTNGERRDESNKRQRDTIIPVDDELSGVLRRWLAIRPDPRTAARPLFTRTGSGWGTRLRIETVHRIVTDHAAAMGWYRDGASAGENVTPHYFRHFFTTYLRDRTGDRGIVQYLRGDVAQDVLDTYTHNWGQRVREVYLDAIYALD
ncbi:tyrosine-type recombinase/integrase [Halococcoides cellulosivorans]|uniref:Integrase n=1 Tax=Halococcoides cellulosivorans TaxID=1679096 RepID=A0A2R4X0I5_9EURY|nr:tyrosine-type recombinase/integrase [Halococcoides cellulosivorans]AWB27312.1 integrase [Halococcoides cellulosivorans]